MSEGKHNQKRESSSAAVSARRKREASRIAEYNGMVQDLNAKMNAKEYSPESFILTTRLLEMNPDFYTVWNHRRTILLHTSLDTADSDAKQAILNKELSLFMTLIRINPKSYWLWNHRMWCLVTMPFANWNGELDLVDKLLAMDARNFHGWDYRRYVVRQLRSLAKDEHEEKAIVRSEFEYTLRKINQKVTNYSAWHQRSKLLPEVVQDMSDKERSKLFEEEMDLAKAAIFTDPNDQSAWLYYGWLMGVENTSDLIVGAFHLINAPTPTTLVVLSNKCTLLRSPEVSDTDGQTVPGQWYRVAGSLDASATWLFASDGGVPHKITIRKDMVAPAAECTATVDAIEGHPDLFTAVKDRRHVLKPKKAYNDPSIEVRPWHTVNMTERVVEELEELRELLEIEPDSKWLLQMFTKLLLLNIRLNPTLAQESEDEVLELLSRLINIDTYHRARYQLIKTRLELQREVRQGVKSDRANALLVSMIQD
ncbi:hypothetical protein BCR43DRAFT_486185 [Syncephalastrum racemosum]|uniref:Geranylgeranyl transferase type-2 subunit alpha n=1 Tax=Syncephalastrum racemosum TaxID=13706 RepID=A0A1X2HNM5_SYNRA|nr:hypothetical protein BCR43DRAFT_486185 [Syncephalastrum racemosum]